MPLSSYSSTKSLIDGIRVWGFPSGCAACLSARQAPDRYPCTPRFTGSMLLIRSIRTRDQSLCKQSRVTAALQCQSQWARICRRAPHVVNARVRDGDHYFVSNPMSTWLGVEWYYGFVFLWGVIPQSISSLIWKMFGTFFLELLGTLIARLLYD